MDNLAFSELLIKLYNLEELSDPIFNFDYEEEHDYLTKGINNSLIGGVIGKEAKAKANKFYFDGKNPVVIYFNYLNQIDEIEILISNSKGDIVYNQTSSNFTSNFIWNGFDNQGKLCPTGEYQIMIICKNLAGRLTNIETYIIGYISKMIFKKEAVFFKINNMLITYDSIIEIMI